MIVRRKAPRRHSARGKLVSECDKRVRALVMAEYGEVCVNPQCHGTTHVIDAAHILGKGAYPRMRFELLNVIPLCRGCHFVWHNQDWNEGRSWFEKAFPGRLEQLRIMAATARKVDLKELLIGLKLEVDALNRPQGSTRLPNQGRRHGETGSGGEDVQGV